MKNIENMIDKILGEDHPEQSIDNLQLGFEIYSNALSFKAVKLFFNDRCQKIRDAIIRANRANELNFDGLIYHIKKQYKMCYLIKGAFLHDNLNLFADGVFNERIASICIDENLSVLFYHCDIVVVLSKDKHLAYMLL